MMSYGSFLNKGKDGMKLTREEKQRIQIKDTDQGY